MNVLSFSFFPLSFFFYPFICVTKRLVGWFGRKVIHTGRSDWIRTLQSITNHDSLDCFLFCWVFAVVLICVRKPQEKNEKKNPILILHLFFALPWPHMLEASVKPFWHEANCPSSVLRHAPKRTDGQTDMARHCSRVAGRRLQLRKQAIKPSQQVWLPARQWA